jgi:hypothetical protein
MRGTRNWTQPIEKNFKKFLQNPDLAAKLNKRQNELAVFDKLLVGSTHPASSEPLLPLLGLCVVVDQSVAEEDPSSA